jgi:hypothetical protein
MINSTLLLNLASCLHLTCLHTKSEATPTMSFPFPGMNPYLENPEIWAEVHHWLITGIAEVLVSRLRPKYRVAVEKRIYQTTADQALLVGIPDVIVADNLPKAAANVAVATPPTQPLLVELPMPEEIRESYLEVREVATGAVITTLEVLLPKNKRAGDGRTAYENKRYLLDLHILDKSVESI